MVKNLCEHIVNQFPFPLNGVSFMNHLRAHESFVKKNSVSLKHCAQQIKCYKSLENNMYIFFCINSYTCEIHKVIYYSPRKRIDPKRKHILVVVSARKREVAHMLTFVQYNT